MSLISRRLFSLVLVFSVLVTWSHWNFFSNGVVALGLNFSLFWVGVAVIIHSLDASYSFKRDWVWLCPIILVVLSFSLYENPWLKLISLSLLPIVVGVFCAYSHFHNRRDLLWNRKLLGAICARFFKPLSAAGKVVKVFFDRSQIPSDSMRVSAFGRVLRGILLLLPLSIIVLLLLSSADALFGEVVQHAIRATLDAMSWLWVLKLAFSLLLAIALLSIAVGWNEPIAYSEASDAKSIDGLVAGIVLGGLLIIYIAFLSLQIENLVIEELPESFREAELMVKSGFWQLFLLAVLNSGLFFSVYRKIGSIAQWVLRVFIVASSLLMVSAAWKVWLYSYTFGLSYEKFFACYTAVFALGVLLYLVAASFSSHRRNVVKNIAFAALWGYGIATISPVERVIFHANLNFSEQKNTRITLAQLTQLSLDIMGDVDEVFETKLALSTEAAGEWRGWRWVQINEICDRVWFEFNLSAVRACP